MVLILTGAIFIKSPLVITRYGIEYTKTSLIIQEIKPGYLATEQDPVSKIKVRKISIVLHTCNPALKTMSVGGSLQTGGYNEFQ